MPQIININSSAVVFFVLAGTAVIALLFGFIIHFVVSYRNKQKAYLLLEEQKQEIAAQKILLEKTLDALKNTQAQLIQAAKMASLGEMTAGIAHEIQNPLNFINNFSEFSCDLMDELKEEIRAGKMEEAISVADEAKGNLQKVVHHGKRADSIVKSMLEHSRATRGEKQLVDINALTDEYLQLSYHGLRAKDKAFYANVITEYDENIEKVELPPQDIGRVLLNLYNNAFYSLAEKKIQLNGSYKPTIWVKTKKEENRVLLSIKDNGTGIPTTLLNKIYQPFFTTKPTGQGTGLGLSLSYDIIKANGGELKVESKEGEYAEFVVSLSV
ncbi:sensor histidine kinase [Segetibacter aerophilus]|uniref:histidine kinase n=1 Tax=Segetibacter aerophilus TaxID=670293 RepID=A0A512B8K0_9BACT|nr:ATP-binding protein [Segetibacter aerophilus]GEO08291.1 hypothetical protein SAE01_07870 [Segetibacter aerophilus]